MQTPIDVTSLLQHKALVIAACLLLLLFVGWRWPFARQTSVLRRWGRNLGLAGVNAGVSALMVLPLTMAAATAAAVYMPDWRPAWWHGTPGLVVDIVVLDLWLYAWHRANHALPILWRFHEIHHLDETLDATSALRFHFGEVLLSGVLRALVVLLLGMPLASVLLFEVLVAVVAMFHHANLRLPPGVERALSWWVVTPSIHWVHHHAVHTDTNSHYATVFSVWDRLFGSRSATLWSADMRIGVQGAPDQTWARLLFRPFWRDTHSRSPHGHPQSPQSPGKTS